MPQDLAATGGPQRLDLTWSPVLDEGPVEYVVQHRVADGPDEWTASATATAAAATIEGLAPETTYLVRVAAVDAVGNRSAFTEAVSAQTDPLPPEPPE